ncbi:metal-dependent hydrolase [Methanonatronarchaeum sp. AMET6-2]|uniref:metal-dependent hydrolase n=1 Tax=Methanonatronarchaeum sp. AMET6-2 TaxID=2933293 RepID=UPI00121ECE5A|nr:metal-dependent hydrolase [Methanonatronarchaeum sp. AMET6-2]RZN60719.1 MAG: metal-dependent hydrolase [Methanonatronarchaeia archaeon]UOY09886.1 metal-dependent hydrolase [Methanonatronarchaeum sp. AMET6-2]
MELHQEGHIGLCLLFYTPIVYTGQHIGVPWILLILSTATAISIANIPDIDLKTTFLSHRGFTHTILFALITGTTTGFLYLGIASLFNPFPLEIRIAVLLLGFLTGFLAITSHIAGDMLTPMGVKPYWPLKNKKISLSLFKARNRLANTIFLALGIIIYTSSIWQAL